jgi:cysteine synthase
VEGTGGNTGIGMAAVAAARGHRAILVMPESVSKEKQEFMRMLGAEVVLRPVVPFSDSRHYCHTAKRIAETTKGAVYGNQFESFENMRAHLLGTGVEIWEQTGGAVDAFVCASGTGGTIGGVSHALKSRKPGVMVYLIDPPGSSLAGFVDHGELEATPGPTITEGIGNRRLTANFSAARIDGALRGGDDEAVAMSRYLLQHEGLCVGPSAALNIVGAVKVARTLKPGSTVVTVICDGGERYRSTLWNEAFLSSRGLTVPGALSRGDLSFVRS